MTIKMMTGKQVNFLKVLVGKKLVAPEVWTKILKDLDVKKEEDLYHLSVEQASGLIYTLINMPDK